MFFLDAGRVGVQEVETEIRFDASESFSLRQFGLNFVFQTDKNIFLTSKSV